MVTWPWTKNSRWRPPPSCKNKKNRYISATVWPIATKSGSDTVLPSWLLRQVKISKFQKSKTAAAVILKMEKSPYLHNGLTYRHEIWHNDAAWPSWPFRPLKFRKFKNPRWQQLASWQIEKSPYICNSLTDRHEIWHDAAGWPSWPFRPSDSGPKVEIRQFHTCALKNDTVSHNGLGYGEDTTFHRT